MTDQELTNKINSKIEILKLTKDDLPRIFGRNKLKEVTKIVIFIEIKLEQNQDLKRQVQKAIFEDEKVVEELISQWGRQLGDRLEEFISRERRTEVTIEKLRIAEEEKSRTEETEL